MFGTFPALSQSLEGATNTFPRNEAGSQPLLETDLGGQGSRPHTDIEAKVAGAAMQQIPECLYRFVWKGRTQSMGTRRAFLQNGESCRIEAMDDVEYGLPVASKLLGYSRRPFATIRRQQDLGSSQDKGVFGA